MTRLCRPRRCLTRSAVLPLVLAACGCALLMGLLLTRHDSSAQRPKQPLPASPATAKRRDAANSASAHVHANSHAQPNTATAADDLAINPNNNNQDIRSTLLCLVGPALSAAQAQAVHRRWGSRFPSAWFVPGAPDGSPPLAGCDIVHGASNELAAGVGRAAAGLLAAHNCRYFFVHDPQLRPLPRDGGLQPMHEVLAAELERLGNRSAGGGGEPAVVVFGREAAGGAAPQCPLLLGASILHRRVLDGLQLFAAPTAAERSFGPSWLLSDALLRWVGGRALSAQTVCLDAIRFAGPLAVEQLAGGESIDSDDELLRVSPVAAEAVGFVRGEGQHLDLAGFRRFLQGSQKCLHCRLDSDSAPRVAGDGLAAGSVAEALRAHFDLRHPSLARLRAAIPQAPTFVAATPIALEVHVFTYNRPASLKRLWASLCAAQRPPSGVRLSIHLHVDHADGEVATSMAALARSLESPHGPVTVRCNAERHGLRSSILESWAPTHADTYAMLLEDDVEVSPLVFRYTAQALRRQFYGPHILPKLAGLSLYNQRYNEMTETPLAVDNGQRPFFWQMPQSWGAVYAPRFWSVFLDYCETHRGEDFMVPDSLANRWPAATSWKKAAVRLMAEEGWALLYPNLPGRLSLSTNHLEVGENDRLRRGSRSRRARAAKFELELVREGGEVGVEVGEEWVVDMWGRRVDGWEALPLGAERIRRFDTCAAVLRVVVEEEGRRGDVVEASIRRLCGAQHVARLVLVVEGRVEEGCVRRWQDAGRCAGGQGKALEVVVEVGEGGGGGGGETVLGQLGGSLLRPRKSLESDCVVLLGDVVASTGEAAAAALVPPLPELDFAVQVWRMNFFERLVGLTSAARLHRPAGRGGGGMGWEVQAPGRVRAASMLLATAGTVVHRRHLVRLWKARGEPRVVAAQARLQEVVERASGVGGGDGWRSVCRDMLLNFVVGAPVAVIQGGGPAVGVGREDGGKMVGECFAALVGAWGGAPPLMYTTTVLDKDKHYGSTQSVPGLAHSASQRQLPDGA